MKTVPESFHKFIGLHFSEDVSEAIHKIAKAHGMTIDIANTDIASPNIDHEPNRIVITLNEESIIQGYHVG